MSFMQVFDKGPMLRLELWNHRRAKLMLLVPEQHALFQELQAEAYRRFNRWVGSRVPMLVS